MCGEREEGVVGRGERDGTFYTRCFLQERRPGRRGLRTPDVGETLGDYGVQNSKADGEAGGRL